MARKTFSEKLHAVKDLPRIQYIGVDNKLAKRFGQGHMLIAAPVEYDEVMKLVPEGRLIMADKIREYLAKKHNADYTCPLTAGLFINLAAHAAEERRKAGDNNITPYWRTLKTGGELNEKYPGGIEQHKLLLEKEGHEIVCRGKRYFVKDFEKFLITL